jgi:hypothetical protein
MGAHTMIKRGWMVAAVFSMATSWMGCAVDAGEDFQVEEARGRADCELVRCAVPECADGQHLSYQGRCCPTCVGAPSRCATVLCLAVACEEGEILVTSPGDCCGHCVKAPAAQECRTDDDCPQIACFACPCPVATCQGRQCVTRTPDESTCGNYN